MSSHDTPEGKPHRAPALQALIIEETTDLLLQACGLAGAQKPEQFNQSRAVRADSPKTGTDASGRLDPVME